MRPILNRLKTEPNLYSQAGGVYAVQGDEEPVEVWNLPVRWVLLYLPLDAVLCSFDT
jgi:hypothetical protein